MSEKLRQILFQIFPHTSTHFLIKTFLQPRRFKRPVKEEELWQKGKIWTSANAKIIGRLYIQNKNQKLVVFLHGWSGRGSQFYAFVEPLLSRGYSVLLLDGPAHGDSNGDATNLPRFTKQVVEALKAENVYAIIGHSFGALSSLLSAKFLLKAKKRIIIGSPFLSQTIVDRFCKRLRIPSTTKKVFINRLNSLSDLSLKDIDQHPHFTRADCHLLIVHDYNDKEVPIDRAKSLSHKYLKSKTYFTKGLGHHRILRNKEAIATILDFLDDK